MQPTFGEVRERSRPSGLESEKRACGAHKDGSGESQAWHQDPADS